MAEERVNRKLAAILAGDVVGFSRLMGEDEVGALKLVTTHLEEVVMPAVDAHRGRIFKTMGDGFLAEFASAVEAVECAVRIQRTMEERTHSLSEDRRVIFRIGINLGDVIVQGDDVFGDGVNVAARIESLADPGGIFISRDVYKQVHHRINLSLEDLGDKTLKNIKQKVRTYRVNLDEGPVEATSSGGTRMKPVTGVAVAVAVILIIVGARWFEWQSSPPDDPSKAALNLADPVASTSSSLKGPEVAESAHPSVAVLPFINISENKQHDYFGDGLAENLITTLSQLPDVFVISRNSSFTYKNNPVKVQQIAEELRIRYVVTGSFQKIGEHIRVHAQFVDGSTGLHLWAERYDRPWSDVFKLQDELTQKIVLSLELKLSDEQKALLSKKYTDDVEAYDYFLQGQALFYGYTAEGNAYAREMYQRAIDRDPDFARAIAGLALTYAFDFRFGWNDAGEVSLKRAQELSHKALMMDDTLPQAPFVVGVVHQFRKTHRKAIQAGQQAIALDQNYSDAYVLVAFSQTFIGNADESIELMEKAMRLNPHTPAIYHSGMGRALYFAGRMEDAKVHLQRAVELNPAFITGYVFLAAVLSNEGSLEEAEWKAEEILILDPDFSIETWFSINPLVYEAYINVLYEDLKRAGLPEKTETSSLKK